MRACLLMGLALAACSPGDRGVLQPIASPGVEPVSTHGLPGDTARVAVGDVTADVTGSWSNANETVEVVYRARTPIGFPFVATSTWRGQALPASAAWDRSVPAAGNAVGRPLLSTGSNTGRIELTGKTTTIVQIEFARSGDPRPGSGDEVAIAIPMPQGARTVRFRVAPE